VLLAAGASVAGLALAVALWAVVIEPRRLVVRRHTLRLPRWPAELDGLRLALIADLHAGAPQIDAARAGRIAARVNRLRPDLVAVLGDLVDHTVVGGNPPEPERVAAALGGVRGRLGVLAVLGNHDWLFDGERVRAALQDAGIPVLEDDARELGGLWVAGLADLQERDPDVTAVLRAVPDGAPLLLLSHNPDVFPTVPERVALTVAGHTHGGQVDLPLVKPRAIPSRYGDRYARGHVVEGGRHLFVTSGVGTSRWPVRLRRPPEAVLLVLRRGG
jgi:hypothetical protein